MPDSRQIHTTVHRKDRKPAHSNHSSMGCRQRMQMSDLQLLSSRSAGWDSTFVHAITEHFTAISGVKNSCRRSGRPTVGTAILSMPKGTPLFKDRQLAAITLLRTRFHGESAGHSLVMPTARIVEVLSHREYRLAARQECRVLPSDGTRMFRRAGMPIIQFE